MLPINTHNYPLVANRYQSQLAFSSDKKNTDAGESQDSEKSEINDGFTTETDGDPPPEILELLKAKQAKIRGARLLLEDMGDKLDE